MQDQDTGVFARRETQKEYARLRQSKLDVVSWALKLIPSLRSVLLGRPTVL